MIMKFRELTTLDLSEEQWKQPIPVGPAEELRHGHLENGMRQASGFSRGGPEALRKLSLSQKFPADILCDTAISPRIEQPWRLQSTLAQLLRTRKSKG